MFTDKTLSVDHRAGKIALDTSPLTHGGKDPNVSRQNSFSYAFMQSLDESGTNTGTSTPVSATVRYLTELSTNSMNLVIECALLSEAN